MHARAMVAEDTVELIHHYMLELDAFFTPGAAAKRLGYHGSTLSVAFKQGLQRGWYEVRDSAKWTNPVTGGPATEYRAVRVVTRESQHE
jgi:hypothetical protein